MALNDRQEKRDYALDLLRTAPINSDAWDAAAEYLHWSFINELELEVARLS
jgi:hypothetical protein